MGTVLVPLFLSTVQIASCKVYTLKALAVLLIRAQKLCESRGGRSGLPVPNSPYGLCGRKATLLELAPSLMRAAPVVTGLHESRFGLAVRRYAAKRRILGSVLLRLTYLFKGCALWTQSWDFAPHNE